MGVPFTDKELFYKKRVYIPDRQIQNGMRRYMNAASCFTDAHRYMDAGADK